MLFSIVLAILSTAAATQDNSLPRSQEPAVPYRVLHRDVSTNDSGRTSSYTLSVDRFLSAGEMGVVICQLLQQEKPASSSRLAVQIFYMVERVGPDPTIQFPDRMLADYVWNAIPVESRHHLTVTTDTNGVRLARPVAYQFDHTTACGITK
jgi:hypothetical protein